MRMFSLAGRRASPSNPKCSLGCPLNMEIPKIIKLVKEGDLESAYRKVLEKSYFGSVCSRVCPHSQQCEGNCVRGIASSPVEISEVEKYVSDWGMNNIKEEIPLEKIGKAQDIEKCVEWLIEDEYTTGQIISINGGWGI